MDSTVLLTKFVVYGLMIAAVVLGIIAVVGVVYNIRLSRKLHNRRITD